MTAPTSGWIVAGRVLQGLGAAGPRVVATAIVRDLYDGRAMARIVSLIMTVFMLVPMFAPLIGQGLEALAGWRAIFGLYLVHGGRLRAAWHLSLPETLPPERRAARCGSRPLGRAFAEVLTTPATMLYTAGAGMIFAAFAAFLASAQQVYEEIYGLGALFPLVFALMALVFALAQFTNSRLVMTLGMRVLCRIAAAIVVVAGLAAVAVRAWLLRADAALAVPAAAQRRSSSARRCCSRTSRRWRSSRSATSPAPPRRSSCRSRRWPPCRSAGWSPSRCRARRCRSSPALPGSAR